MHSAMEQEYVEYVTARMPARDEKRLAWATWLRLSTSLPERPAPEGPDLDERAMLQRALAQVPPRGGRLLAPADAGYAARPTRARWRCSATTC